MWRGWGSSRRACVWRLWRGLDYSSFPLLLKKLLQTEWLKTAHVYYFTVSAGQGSGRGSAPGLIRLPSRCHLGCSLIWGLTLRLDPLLLAMISFLEPWAWGPQSPADWARDYPQLLETAFRSWPCWPSSTGSPQGGSRPHSPQGRAGLQQEGSEPWGPICPCVLHAYVTSIKMKTLKSSMCPV